MLERGITRQEAERIVTQLIAQDLAVTFCKQQGGTNMAPERALEAAD